MCQACCLNIPALILTELPWHGRESAALYRQLYPSPARPGVESKSPRKDHTCSTAPGRYLAFSALWSQPVVPENVLQKPRVTLSKVTPVFLLQNLNHPRGRETPWNVIAAHPCSQGKIFSTPPPWCAPRVSQTEYLVSHPTRMKKIGGTWPFFYECGSASLIMQSFTE